MSVLVVSNKHISVLVNAAIAGRDPMVVSTYTTGLGRVAHDTAQTWGQYLLDENVLAGGGRDEAAVYKHDPMVHRIPVEVLRLLHAYRYQICELPSWQSRDSRKFCEALEGRMIRKLPGYQDAPWTVD